MKIAIRIRVGNAAPVEISMGTGTLLTEALRGVGVAIDQPCGGRGVCGKCRVRIMKITKTGQIDGKSEEKFDGKSSEKSAETSEVAAESAIVAACQYRVTEPIEVEIAAEQLVETTEERIQTAFANTNPEVPSVVSRETEARHRTDGAADKDDHWAIAVDLGTTTLAAGIVDLITGKRVALTARRNPQTAFGADVISRIQYASGEHASQGLQKSVLEAIDEMVKTLCEECGVSPERVASGIVAGNTTMQQLLMGRNVEPLGQYPFTPETYGTIRGIIGELARRCGAQLRTIPKRCVFETFPVIGGFVGGDIVAGLLATRFMDLETPAIFLDIGTNGEMVLRAPSESGQWTFLATATAAGPAFEGAKIRCGTRAMTGAIQHCGITDGKWRNDVIGGGNGSESDDDNSKNNDRDNGSERSDENERPIVGICGSALPDAVATLLELGVLTPDGRLLTGERLPPHLSADLKNRVVQDGRHGAFVLANENSSANPFTDRITDSSTKPFADRTAVVLTQRDVREIQLASGAIRTGIELLLKRANMKASQLAQVVIAGGFGSVLDRDSIRRIGMLPPTITPERIQMVGNSALAGAIDWAIEPELRATIHRISQITTAIDLSADPEFQRTFAESMRFPEN